MTDEIAPVFFLHRRLLRDVLAPGRRGVLVHGGRGLGKSALVAHLCATRAGTRRLDGLDFQYDGGATAFAEALSAAIDEAGHSDVVVDDVDRCFSSQLTRVIRPTLFRATNRARVVFTSRVAPDLIGYGGRRTSWDADQVEAWSDLVSQFHPLPVDPWREDGLNEHLRAIVSSPPDESMSWFVHTGAMEEVLAALGHLVAEITGGHPSLLGPTLVELDRLRRLPRDEGRHYFLAENLRADGPTGRHLENHLADVALRSVASAVRWLERRDPRAAALLSVLAKGEPPGERSAIEYKALREEGLVRESDDGRHIVPCRLIRELVLRQSPLAPERAPEAPPVPTAGALLAEVVSHDANSGTLRVRSALGEPFVNVALSDTMWRLALTLVKHTGTPVSVVTLRESIGADNDHAVRSGLQRLLKKLDTMGMGGLIENVHGRGYRVVRPIS